MAITTAFDRIITSAPISKGAALARDGKGVHFDERVSPTTNRWEGPPPLKVWPRGSDLSKLIPAGTTFGRLTVLGVWAGSNPKKNATYVCRCVCGAYEGYRAKGLNGGNIDRCEACVALERIKNTERAFRK